MLFSSTVMTPSLPTLSIASAIISPIVGSAAEIDAVAAICSLVSTVLGLVGQRLGHRGDGLLDAALERDRVRAGGDVAQPFADQRLGQHGRRRRAVAGHVVGLLGDLLDQFGAELLVRVVELDLLGDAHPVVGDRGHAPLRVQHDVAALRAERHLHRVGEDVHAALQAATGLFTESDQLGHLRRSSTSSCRRAALVGPTCDDRCYGPPPGGPIPFGWHSHRASANHSAAPVPPERKRSTDTPLPAPGNPGLAGSRVREPARAGPSTDGDIAHRQRTGAGWGCRSGPRWRRVNAGVGLSTASGIPEHLAPATERRRS